MKITGIIGVFLMILTVSSCNSTRDKDSAQNGPLLKTLGDSACYAIGMGLSAQFKYFNEEDFNAEAMESAMNSALNGEEFIMTAQEKDEVIKSYFLGIKSFYNDSLLKRSKKWLEENKTKEGVLLSPRGVQFKYLKKGEGAGISPDGNDIVYVRYEQGSPYRGLVWDESISTNPRDTIQMALNRELSGFSEGMQMMRVGDKVRMWLPPEIGSAEGTDPASVAIKNEVIYIDVELLRVKDRKTSLIEDNEKNAAPGYFINEEERND